MRQNSKGFCVLGFLPNKGSSLFQETDDMLLWVVVVLMKNCVIVLFYRL